MKEELRKTKQDFHLEQLELEKARTTIQDLESHKKKIEKKYQAMDVKYQSNLETLELI